jgi:hypothetical protein
MATTTNTDSQNKLNTALATLKAGGNVPISKTSAARQVNGQIYIYNPQVVQAFQFVGNKEKVAAAVASGKISPISQNDLSAALNPTKPTVPKPVGSRKPKTKLKGSADDDKGKKKAAGPNVKLRTEADPSLVTGRRLKNPLGALSSYNYQLSLYMVTPDAMETFREDGFKSISKLGVAYSDQVTDIEGAGVTAGAYIVAQSGGINNQFEKRAPSFGLDYNIDNLSFEVAGPKETGAPAAEYNYNFTIIEPYGFSFISNLKRAANAINDYTNRISKKRSEIAKKQAAAKKQRENAKKNNNNQTRQANQTSTEPQTDNINNTTGQAPDLGGPENPSKQLFVLGIRFLGYNASGKPVRGMDTTAATNSAGGVVTGQDGTVTQEIDPGNSSYNLFERYYPIILTKVKTTVDGRATKYECEATSYNMEGLSTKRGQINTPIEAVGSTVGEQLDDLMEKLNDEQKKLNNGSGLGYTYAVKYSSEKDAERIRSAQIVSAADIDKYKWPGSGAKTSKQSNANTETQKNNKPKNTERRTTISKGTAIIAAINQIIAQSKFLEDALKTVYTTALEPNQDKKDLPALDQPGKKTIEWFSCTPDIRNLKWNSKTADWVYDINYILTVYDTPILDAAYTNPGKEYYGPAKRYDYWYSGTNTEILKYQQVLDNNYYTTYLSDDFGQSDADKKANQNGGQNTTDATNGSGNGAGVTTSLVQNQRTGQPTQGKAGVGMEAQNSYLTSLFDASAVATATIDILGDPDWLMSTTSAAYDDKGSVTLGRNEGVVYSKFYGRDGYTVNPDGGQIFFEIDFKEAIDYKSEAIDVPGISGAPGTLAINSSILFWKDPKSTSKLVKGISYNCTKVKSTFLNGIFKQTLSAQINTFADAGSTDNGTGRENKNTAGNSGSNNGNGNATTSNRGLPVSNSGLKAKGGRTSGRGTPSVAEQSRIDRTNAPSSSKSYTQPPKGPLKGGYAFGGET